MSAMQLKSIANRLVQLCREGKEDECLNTLYHEGAVSVEAMAMPGQDSAEMVGIPAIKAKHEWWNNTFEIHSGEVIGPYFHGNDRFGVIFTLDATNKETNKRENMQEVAIYTVKDGKIVREEFFYETD